MHEKRKKSVLAHFRHDSWFFYMNCSSYRRTLGFKLMQFVRSFERDSNVNTNPRISKVPSITNKHVINNRMKYFSFWLFKRKKKNDEEVWMKGNTNGEPSSRKSSNGKDRSTDKVHEKLRGRSLGFDWRAPTYLTPLITGQPPLVQIHPLPSSPCLTPSLVDCLRDISWIKRDQLRQGTLLLFLTYDLAWIVPHSILKKKGIDDIE